MTSNRTSRGYTLIEILTALLLSGFILTGLIQIHSIIGRLMRMSGTSAAGRWTVDVHRLDRWLVQSFFIRGIPGYGFKLISEPSVEFQFSSLPAAAGSEGGWSSPVHIEGRFTAGKGLYITLTGANSETSDARDYLLLEGCLALSIDCMDTGGNWLAEWDSDAMHALPAAVRLAVYPPSVTRIREIQRIIPIAARSGS